MSQHYDNGTAGRINQLKIKLAGCIVSLFSSWVSPRAQHYKVLISATHDKIVYTELHVYECEVWFITLVRKMWTSKAFPNWSEHTQHHDKCFWYNSSVVHSGKYLVYTMFDQFKLICSLHGDLVNRRIDIDIFDVQTADRGRNSPWNAKTTVVLEHTSQTAITKCLATNSTMCSVQYTCCT